MRETLSLYFHDKFKTDVGVGGGGAYLDFGIMSYIFHVTWEVLVPVSFVKAWVLAESFQQIKKSYF